MSDAHAPDGPQDVVPGRPHGVPSKDSMPVIRPDGVQPPAPAVRHGEIVVHDGGTLPAAPPPETHIVTVFGDARRSGRFRVAPHTSVSLLFGDLTLDLREAILDADVVELRTDMLFGDVRLVVPPGVDVQMRTTTVFGDATVHPGCSTDVPHTHTVVVHGVTVFGDVTVHTLEVGAPIPTLWGRLKTRWAQTRRSSGGT
ncbi:LiaF domain-containing protein [Mobilicoccus pelagius]|nr:LiaF domain-containing protein [Mobilicoccus pelagius]